MIIRCSGCGLAFVRHGCPPDELRVELESLGWVFAEEPLTAWCSVGCRAESAPHPRTFGSDRDGQWGATAGELVVVERLPG